jgi:hypothetical protein
MLTGAPSAPRRTRPIKYAIDARAKDKAGVLSSTAISAGSPLANRFAGRETHRAYYHDDRNFEFICNKFEQIQGSRLLARAARQ